MRKILAIMALAISSSAFAASVTVTGANVDGVQGSPNQTQYGLGVKGNINKNLAGDVSFLNVQTNNTNALSTRLEAGLTGENTYGMFTSYARVAVGEKYTNTSNFTYYSIEPGVKVPFGTTGITGQVGYRFRNAVDTANNDTSRTWRAGLSYAMTKVDSIGLRYDSVRGDQNQNIVAVSYTRGF